MFNWEWFMTNRRATIFVDLIGRTRARVFYATLGIFLAALGFAGAFGLI